MRLRQRHYIYRNGRSTHLITDISAQEKRDIAIKLKPQSSQKSPIRTLLDALKIKQIIKQLRLFHPPKGNIFCINSLLRHKTFKNFRQFTSHRRMTQTSKIDSSNRSSVLLSDLIPPSLATAPLPLQKPDRSAIHPEGIGSNICYPTSAVRTTEILRKRPSIPAPLLHNKLLAFLLHQETKALAVENNSPGHAV